MLLQEWTIIFCFHSVEFGCATKVWCISDFLDTLIPVPVIFIHYIVFRSVLLYLWICWHVTTSYNLFKWLSNYSYRSRMNYNIFSGLSCYWTCYFKGRDVWHVFLYSYIPCQFYSVWFMGFLMLILKIIFSRYFDGWSTIFYRTTHCTLVPKLFIGRTTDMDFNFLMRLLRKKLYYL